MRDFLLSMCTRSFYKKNNETQNCPKIKNNFKNNRLSALDENQIF